MSLTLVKLNDGVTAISAKWGLERSIALSWSRFTTISYGKSNNPYSTPKAQILSSFDPGALSR